MRRPPRSPDVHHRASFWVALSAVAVTLAGASFMLFAPGTWVERRPSLAPLEAGDPDPEFRAHAVETVEDYCRHLQKSDEAGTRELLDAALLRSRPKDPDAARVTSWTVEQVAADQGDARVRLLQQLGRSPLTPRTRVAVFRLHPVGGVWRIYDVRVVQ